MRPPEPVPREPHLPWSAGQQPLARQQALVDRRRETTVTAATIRRRSHDPAATARALPPGRWSAAPLPATGWSAAPANPTVIVADFLRSEPPQLGVDHPGQRNVPRVRGVAARPPEPVPREPHLPWSAGQQPLARQQALVDRRRETTVTAATIRRRSHDPAATARTLPPGRWSAAPLPATGWSAAPANPTVTVAEFLRSEPPQLGVDHPGSAQRAPGARRGSASTRAGSAGTALPWSTGQQPSGAATPDGD